MRGSIFSTAAIQAAIDSGSSRHSSSVIPIGSAVNIGSTRSPVPSGQSTGSHGTIWPFVQVALIAFMVHLLITLNFTRKPAFRNNLGCALAGFFGSVGPAKEIVKE